MVQQGQVCQAQRVVAAVAVEGVGVEVVLAVAGEAAEGVVEERQLQHVGVAAVEVEVEHALGPEDQRDGGAGLGVGGGVGEVVGLGEALVGGGGAEAGGDVDLRGHDVLPRASRRRASGVSSPSSAARSAMAEYMYMARTAWPTTRSCSRTGRWDWLYS